MASVRPGQRQADTHQQPAQLAVLQLKLAMQGIDDILHNGQPEAVPRCLLVCTPATLHQLPTLPGVKTGAVILDSQQQLPG